MRSLQFRISRAPVSQQASGKLKSEVKDAIRDSIRQERLFLTGEIRLNVDWLVRDQIRYETDRAPDVDNILKPTIDALTGPDGIIFDDCQVQRVNCGWIDWNGEGQAFDIEIEYIEDQIISSKNVFFVQFRNGLCFPFDGDLPIDANRFLAKYLNGRLDARLEFQTMTDDYKLAMLAMPMQRFFHRTRVNGFDVVPYETIIAEPAR